MFVIIVLWAAFFVINFNVAMMIPLLPFMQHDIGLTPGESGLVLAAFPVVALLANLALGPFIDRYGRRRFIVAGAAGCAGLLLATAAGHSAAPVVLGRAATGLFMPMVGASVFAAIADHVPPSGRARAAGIVTSAAPIAFLVSMSLGLLLGGLVSWRASLILFAAVCLALAVAASALPAAAEMPGAPVSWRSYRERLLPRSPASGTGLLLACYFCWSAGMYVFLGLYPGWLVQHGLAGAGTGVIGLVLFLGELGGLAGALLSPRLSRLFGHGLVACAMASLAIALLMPLVPLGVGRPLAQALAYGLFAFGRDLMLALILGGAMTLVPAGRRGSLNATLNAVYQSGATLGGLASARLYGLRPDFTANAAVASAVFAACAVMLWILARLRPRADALVAE